jgi:polyhydroxyalkanoate synthase subunit PhaC
VYEGDLSAGAVVDLGGEAPIDDDSARAFDDYVEHALATLGGEEPEPASPPGPAVLSRPVRAVAEAAVAAANVYDLLLGDDGTATPARPGAVIDSGPQRTVRRFEPRSGSARASVLLVPPLGGPASCFDLRPGASLIEDLTWSGYRAYLLDYGPISYADRDLGLEHWVGEVIPPALRSATKDAGEEIHVVGWCLGGIISTLALAADRELPARTLSLVATPFDFTRVTLLDPVRRIGAYTGGAILDNLFRVLGSVPAPLVSAGFRLTAIDRYLTRPLFLARNLANREALVHMRAVDRYMANMHAYPGRTLGQLYRDFFWDGALASGTIEVGGRTVGLADLRRPVLLVAGKGDVLAPPDSVHRGAELLTGAPEVREETAPGGHLGVLTGMRARGTTWAHIKRLVARHPAG